MTTSTFWTPVGSFCVTCRGTTVVSVRLGVAASPTEAAVPRVVSRSFERWSRGEMSALDTLDVDLGACTPFQRRVWETLRRVRSGALITYGDLAARAGVPGGARAVGQAMRLNPVPLIVPCHRVVASQHAGGFSAGAEWKRFLLEQEGQGALFRAPRGARC